METVNPWELVIFFSRTYYYLKRAMHRGRISVIQSRKRDTDFYRTVWKAAADSHGASFRALHGSVFEISKNNHLIRINRNATPIDNPAAVTLAGDKVLSYKLMSEARIPVPYHILIEARDFNVALRLLRSSSTPLVVKPAGGTGGGAGVSTNITAPLRLLLAIAWAASYSRKILIEKQIEGDCYRILIIDNRVADVVVRRPPTVIGDGVSTISQLLSRENRMRLTEGTRRAQTPIRVDHDLRNTLASQGLALSSRPVRNQPVILKHAVNDNNALENVPANGVLCPAILAAALRAAAITGTRFAGVDLICTDPTVPLEVSGGVIIEVNAPPGFYYHYRLGNATSFPVAEHVLTALLNSQTAAAS